jgi:hypothetical protein
MSKAKVISSDLLQQDYLKHGRPISPTNLTNATQIYCVILRSYVKILHHKTHKHKLQAAIWAADDDLGDNLQIFINCIDLNFKNLYQ